MDEEPNSSGINARGGYLKPLVSIGVVLLVVISLYFVVRALPLEMLGEIRPKRLALWTLPLIVFLQLVFLLVAAQIWRWIVRVLTGTTCTLWDSYMQLAVVTVGKYVPGKVWGFVARAGDMYRHKIPLHLSMMSSVIEQLLLMTGGLIVSVVAALIALPQYRVEIIIAGGLLSLVAIAVLLNVPALTRWILRHRKAQEIPRKIPGYHVNSVFGFTLAYAALWVLSGTIFCIIYFSLFDAAVSVEIIAALTLANTLGIILGFFAFFAPGGIGIREAITTGVLAGFVPIREALLAAVCYRAWLILMDGLNAMLILVRETRLAKRGRKSEIHGPQQ